MLCVGHCRRAVSWVTWVGVGASADTGSRAPYKPTAAVRQHTVSKKSENSKKNTLSKTGALSTLRPLRRLPFCPVGHPALFPLFLAMSRRHPCEVSRASDVYERLRTGGN